LASRHTPTGAPVRSGGGIDTNKMKRVGTNYGSTRTNVVNPSGADQLGQAMPDRMRQGHHVAGNSAEQLFARSAQAATPMGNQVAAQTVAGPGGSRTVYRSGYQQQWAPPAQGANNPAPHPPATGTTGRDILRDYGPERSRR
jgi:hypothetical protein